MDGKIYLDTIYNEVYCISGDAYEEIEETGLGESGNGASGLFSIYWGNLVYSMLAEGNIIENDSGTDFETKYGINGTDFTDWLEYLSEQEISNSIEFDILYGKYLIDKGFSQTFEIVCWQDGVYYYYYDEACMEMLSTETEDEFATTTAVALDIKDMGEVEEEVEETKKITDGSLVMYGYDVDCTDIVLPEEIMGYSVTGIDFQPYDTSIVLCFEEYPYANVNIELHENITYISPIIFNTIYCEEGSYAHQYAEEMGNPYILGNIEKNRNDELIYPEKYRMSENIKKYTSCVNENSRYGEDAYYCFVDINKDDVYELFLL